jgi:hypothetical protein
MNSLIQFKTTVVSGVIAVVLACFGLLPKAQAVNPPPDGGYPGGNTAEGEEALLSLTTGEWNTAVGFRALFSNRSGAQNTATGSSALISNTAGFGNTANGVNTLYNNTTGSDNTASGARALFNNTIGVHNTADGDQALFSNTTGSNNTATGFIALFSNTTGSGNTANGVEALASNTSGYSNTANGGDALASNTTGFANTATGVGALVGNTTGRLNTAIGIGALSDLETGNRNTAIGANALPLNDTGSDNIALGIDAGKSVHTANHVICIGSDGRNVNNSCFIGNIRGVTTAENDTIPVLIDSAGQLGTRSSSRRFKRDIEPMDKSSETILALNPVTFHYASDQTNRPEFGLIAEEVAVVNPDLVVRDKNGEIYTVRYEAVNAMLLNEFLKEHHTVEEQECRIREQEATITQLKQDLHATAARQQKQIEALTVGLQKVSAQLATDESVRLADLKRVSPLGKWPRIIADNLIKAGWSRRLGFSRGL